ncbi:hypothetical protein [Salinibius halmophilus]|uniref:hypothetical protein n=1 Tax=Salinibius halmophilus TaxID=1853216 RepID=UPI000E673CB2|nr:hypothetical protein [Salinibius halmophilus]
MDKKLKKLIDEQASHINERLYQGSLERAKSLKAKAHSKPGLVGREYATTASATARLSKSLFMVAAAKGPCVEGIQEFVSGMLTTFVADQTERLNDAYYYEAIKDEFLVNHWLLALYFGYQKAEVFYREKLKAFLAEPLENSQFSFPEQYDPIYFAFVHNMLASVDNQQLTLVQPGFAYDEFFSQQVPLDALQKLMDIHVQRASKGKGAKDPLEYNPWTAFPLEVLAWYRVAQLAGVEVKLDDSYASQYIQVPFELKITNKDCLHLLGDVSELIGFDVVERYL